MARFSALSRTSIQILSIVCTLASANVLALGLGGIDLKSGLNQPLNAEIEITGATPEELRRLTASIATRETFARYGLEFPQYLNSLEFLVSKNSVGRDVLRVRSREPMDEPFVTFLVEAEWARGRLLREYTVLLDPPVYLPDQSPGSAPLVSTPRSSTSQPSSTSGAVTRPAPAPTPFTAPAAAPVVQAPSGRANSGAAPGSMTGPVRRGDSLWGVANRSRPQSVTVNQMMVALYRANPEAFMGNMNLLRQGARLRVPTEGEVAAITRNEAFGVVKEETASWRGAPASVASTSTPSGAASGTSSGTSAQSADPKLKLVAPDGQADAGGGAALQDAQATIQRATAENMALNERASALEAQLSEARRLLQLKDAELAQFQANVSGADPAALAASTDPATGVGVDLESQALDGVTDTGAATDGLSGEVALGSLTQDALADAQSEPTATIAEPEPAPANNTNVVIPAAPEEVGFFASLVSSPLKAIGSIGMLLALIAGGLLLRQRRSDSAADTLEALAREDDHSSYSDFDSGLDPVITPAPDLPDVDVEVTQMPSPAATAEVAQPVETGIFEETGTFKPVDFDAALHGEETQQTEYVLPDSDDGDANLDQADPVSEADFHMAYGLYDQAADLINKALEREPDRRDLQVKLLEILFVWGNRDEFRSTAARLQGSLMAGADGDWDKIAIMGKQICPDDDLFMGGTGTEADIDIDLQASAESPMAVDFDAEAPSDEVIDLDLRGALTEEGDGLREDTAVTNMSDFEGLGLGDDLADSLNEAADFSLAGFDEDEDADGTMPVNSMEDDPQLHEIARRLEQRMTPVESTENDIGMSLDLGQTIAPETAENPTLNEADFQSDGEGAGDEVFGDFFAFTGVTEDSDAGDQTQRAPDLVLDATGEMLPEQHTGEFPIELPEDDFDIDLSDLAGGDDATQRSGTLAGDTQALGLPRMDDGDSDTSVVNAAEMLSGLGASSEMTQTTESPMMPPASHARSEKDINTLQAPLLNEDGLLNSSDATVSTNVLDLDIGETLLDDKPTVRVPAAELALPSGEDSGLDEVGTKLDLARAYIDMGDSDGARSILEEVIMEGDDTQKKDAGGLLQSL